jgi:hypothetical protein
LSAPSQIQMKIGIHETFTIDALNEISQKYPFAASLLAYAIIERILKEYIMKHRKNHELLDYSFQKPSRKPNQQISLGKYYNLKKQDFIKQFIKNITLGDAEQIVLGNNKNKYSTARNNLMHSYSYLLEERKCNRTERQLVNKNNFEIAIGSLKFVINNFAEGFKVELKNDKLIRDNGPNHQKMRIFSRKA